MTDAVPAVIDSIDDVHHDIRVIRIRPDDKSLTWVAGQYMELAFHGFPPRPYSIASAPHTRVPEFHIRRAGINGVSQHVANSVRPGDTLTLRGPFGDAGMIVNDTLPLVLVAGGMGLPPMKAMIDDSINRGDTRPITLYWGTRTEEEMYLRDYFTALAATHPNFTFVPVVDGLVSQIVADKAGDLSSSRIYLAGPPPMIHSSIEAVLKNGAAMKRIHTDDVPTLNIFRSKGAA